jgi:hypothetical protein
MAGLDGQDHIPTYALLQQHSAEQWGGSEAYFNAFLLSFIVAQN